ncbi:MAG: DNA-directed RNA polymerase subunit alpha [SAR324 cluster bacterium]|nr:DNA-directed RNA polymerase subunit alpha [SAR324 cluster bacterium]
MAKDIDITQVEAAKEAGVNLMNLDIFKDNWEKMDIPETVSCKDTENKGLFVLEPLYKGYGQTIGHSLRRILMSSLVGAAVTAVKIEGVSHEFQTIKYVREDVLQIILNLKDLYIKPLTKGSFDVNIKVKGPKTVTAGDIITDQKVEIINPDHVICHIEHDIDFEMTLFIKIARGYNTAEENFREDLPVGAIYLDSNHSPIVMADYMIENTRVRQKTDYEKLTFNLTTNGCVTPKEALGYACKIITDYYKAFINFDNFLPAPEDKEESPQPAITSNPHLIKNINELELSIRSINCLQNAKIETIAQLVRKTETEMLKTKNFGRKSLQEIKNILASMGLTLGMALPDSPNSI